MSATVVTWLFCVVQTGASEEGLGMFVKKEKNKNEPQFFCNNK